MNTLRSLYLETRLFLALAALVVVLIAGHFVPVLAGVGRAGVVLLALLAGLELVLLYRTPVGLAAERTTADRLSNGDDNEIRITLASRYPFTAHVTVLDELPVQVQVRDARYALKVAPGERRSIRYTVRPVERGLYVFGAVNAYASTPLGLLSRRYRFGADHGVPVYPSYLQMRKYELMAMSNRLEEAGVKRVRRVGHTMEFDHIREYVVGDDYRTLNWRATARRGGLMVNQYQDERSQPVYCLLDTGRVMQMPFEGMSLLDYGVNATLVLANIALLKQDKAGLVAFSNEVGTVLPARRRGGQIYKFQEALYNLRTDFLETDYARLAVYVRRHIRQRSLLLLFTNFETHASMQRQLPYLRALARQHVVVAVFFENTALRGLLQGRPATTEDIYVKAIAEKFAFEKREVVRELKRHGIHAILTPPADLSVNTINKYLELKALGIA
jgi:uncharacterized protein (DUF58 family)